MMESESKLSETEVVRSSVKTVILASMIGTAVEFFDFYAYGTAAAAYFPKVFFPQMTPLLATVLSLLTFGVAFVARPVKAHHQGPGKTSGHRVIVGYSPHFCNPFPKITSGPPKSS